MPDYAFSVDLDRCIGCQACSVACRIGNESSADGSYITDDRYITVTESVRGKMPELSGTFLHHRCFHCTEAACVAVCPTGALAKWNGLTIVKAEKCSGCAYCIDACPYKVPKLVEGRVAKCVACLDLVREGGMPWCARTCPSKAIKFGKRAKLLTNARVRVAAIQKRYPNALVYGENQPGGLGLLTLMPDKPHVFGLPESAGIPRLLGLWQSIVQPFSLGISLLSVIVTGIFFIAARRKHLSELEGMHAQEKTGQAEAGSDKLKTRKRAEANISEKNSMSNLEQQSVPEPLPKVKKRSVHASKSKPATGKKGRPAKNQKKKVSRGKKNVPEDTK